jgi:hypothetical protein
MSQLGEDIAVFSAGGRGGRTETGEPLSPPIDRASTKYTSANPNSVCICSSGSMAILPCLMIGRLRLVPGASEKQSSNRNFVTRHYLAATDSF